MVVAVEEEVVLRRRIKGPAERDRYRKWELKSCRVVWADVLSWAVNTVQMRFEVCVMRMMSGTPGAVGSCCCGGKGNGDGDGLRLGAAGGNGDGARFVTAGGNGGDGW